MYTTCRTRGLDLRPFRSNCKFLVSVLHSTTLHKSTVDIIQRTCVCLYIAYNSVCILLRIPKTWFPFKHPACMPLRTKNYAVKIKSTQRTQENYASEKQKYTNAASGPWCVAKRKNRIDPIFHARNASRQPI